MNKMAKIYDGSTVTVNGVNFTVSIEPDYDMRLPWEEMDGLGVIRQSSKIHSCGYSDKRPGERPMNSPDRKCYQFYYDVQATIKKAIAEGWGLSDEHKQMLSARLGRQPTKREIICEAVERDFNFCSGFINNDWQYYSVSIYPEGEENEYDYCLGGVDDYVDSYPGEVALELIDNYFYDLAKQQKQEKINSRFRDAMACGL